MKLTDEEIEAVFKHLGDVHHYTDSRQLIARAIEAAVMEKQAKVDYTDSTPLLNVGDSAFESWYGQYPLMPVEYGVKQKMRDAYAAGMGDPLVASTMGKVDVEPVAEVERLKQEQAEPGAWAMKRADGLILDVICPEEHESHEGAYTVPLYTAPQGQTALLKQALEALESKWTCEQTARIDVAIQSIKQHLGEA